MDAPHSSQNFAVGRSAAPQLTHTGFSGAAHASQNFAPGRFSWSQDEQRIAGVLACGDYHARRERQNTRVRAPSVS
jgi:hypothetical protein